VRSSCAAVGRAAGSHDSIGCSSSASAAACKGATAAARDWSQRCAATSLSRHAPRGTSWAYVLPTGNPVIVDTKGTLEINNSLCVGVTPRSHAHPTSINKRWRHAVTTTRRRIARRGGHRATHREVCHLPTTPHCPHTRTPHRSSDLEAADHPSS
jgi:hypothetical protein